MASVETHNDRFPPPLEPTMRQREEQKSAEVVAGGSLVEAIAGAAAVVLAILGLAGLFPAFLVAIATIAVGVALLFEGGSIASRYHRLLSETTGYRQASTGLGGGMSVEILGGIAGIVLGILALLRLDPGILIAIAAIVLGGTLLLSSGTTARLNKLVIEGYGWPDSTRRIAHEGITTAASVQVLVGLAGVILGILALLGIYTFDLTLVAMLCIGASVLLSGAAISGKMFSLLHH